MATGGRDDAAGAAGGAILTILFSDVVGSTDLYVTAGDVATRAHVATHDELTRRTVTAHRGRVVKNLGDGAMAVFESPRAALAAAVALQDALTAAREADPGFRLEVRVGLNCGEVLEEQDGDVHGAAVAIAARVAARARGGQVLATDVVARLAGTVPGLELTDVGEVSLKGAGCPVPLRDVRWGREAAPAPDSSGTAPGAVRQRPGRTELVGRSAELSALERWMDDALAGDGRLVLVSGDPGMGKSCLAAEVADQARDRGALVAWGRAAAAEDAPPFWPWIEVLRDLLRGVGRERLAVHAGAGHQDVAGLLPELGAARDAEPPGAGGGSRFRFFDSVTTLLHTAAEERGLLLVVDDLQWADASSLRLLLHLARSMPRSRLLCLCTYRDADGGGGLEPLLADLQAEASCRRIALAGLEPEAVRALLGARTGSEVSAGVAAAVARRTGGNPLFVSEYLRHLVEEGTALGGDASAMPAAVPPGIRDLIGRRVAGFDPGCAGLLRTAAVAGRDLDLPVLARCSSTSLDAVLETLDAPVGARLLLADPLAPWRMSFAHDLVHESLRDAMPASERSRTHRRLAEAIEAVHADGIDGHLSALARHWAGATGPDAASRAAACARRAADRAMGELAHEEAARLYRLCLESAATAEGVLRCEATLGLAEAQHRAGYVEDGLRTSQAAAVLARDLDRPDLVGEAALVGEVIGGSATASAVGALCTEALAATPPEDSVLRVRLLARLCIAREYDQRRPPTESISAEAMAMAERLGDRDARVAALQARQMVRTGPDAVDEREELGRSMLELHGAGAGPWAALWGHLWRVDSLWQRGDIDAASAELDEVEAVADALREPLPRWHLFRARSVIAALRGDFATALGQAQEARLLGRRGQHAPAERFFHVFAISLGCLTGDFGESLEIVEALEQRPEMMTSLLALARLETGDREQARWWYRSAPVTDLTGVPRSAQLTFAAWRTELAARLGDGEGTETARAWLRPYAGLFAAGGAGSPFNYGSASRHLGLAAGAMGNWDDAAANLERAIAANARARALPFVALSQAALAEAIAERGGAAARARALTLAQEALATARRLGMRPLTDRLSTLEGRLAGAPGHPLSRREAEVATLVARGLTSRQIGAELHLSERTVEHHVDSIRSKLGVASRSQVAVWAVGRGLAAPPELGT